MTSTKTLVEEHWLILKALDLLESAAARAEAVPDAWWHGLLDWLHDFADRRHHAKEENVLFPAMVRCGAPERGGPIDVMLEEHVLVRSLVTAMADRVPERRASAAREYARLTREHIDKENLIVFPFAEAILDPPTVEAVRRDFESADRAQKRTLGPATAETELARLAQALVVISAG